MIRHIVTLMFFLVLAGCIADGDRVKNIEESDIDIQQEVVETGGRNKAIESYREFLSKEEDAPLRAEAMRRLADLELEESEAKYLEKVSELEKEQATERKLKPADYGEAIRVYKELLESHPDYAGNDQVLYQLARAYEQSGDYLQALQTLGRLAKSYPNAKFIVEVQFRRGELLFVTNQYREAGRAYSAVLKFGDTSLFYERALYKQGWALFKLSRYKPALNSFVRLLDRKFTDGASQDSRKTSDQELIGDTFRVVTLGFAHLGGEKAITKYFKRAGSRPYEASVYELLGQLYLTQERYVDAAGAFGAFINRYALDYRAPLFQLNVVEAYKQGGFPTLLLEAKETFVVSYGVGSEFWASHKEKTRVLLAPHLKRHIKDLARHSHAQAQKSKKAVDFDRAAHWYAEYVRSFSDDTSAAKMNFLLAETLFDGGRHGDAAVQYEKTAYRYPPHADSTEAGYAALLAHRKHEQQLRGNEKSKYHRVAIRSALRFGSGFPTDKRAAAVLTKAAEDLFALDELEQAAAVARQVVTMKSLPRMEIRRTAWTVIAHVEFEKKAFGSAEMSYQAVLRLTPADAPTRDELVERLASSVYKQGEQHRAAGDMRIAVNHFLRVKEVAPTSSVTPVAEYDAAAGLLSLKQWNDAARVLELFRKRFPGHALQAEVPEKLAAAYLGGEQWSLAAAAVEEIADLREDEQERQIVLWQAAELYEKGARRDLAAAVYKRYIKLFPKNFERTMEARHQLTQIYETSGQRAEYYRWLQQIVHSADKNKRSRTNRTQYLAANAAFLLAERGYERFRSVRLVIPLKQSLKTKKQNMKITLKEYRRVVDYGVAEFTTAATFRIAEIYHDLSRDLLASERPKGLSPEELEQYDVLLEEQAYPFEETAIEIHETNIQRVADGVYDKWIKRSFQQLSRLRPVRYAKVEKSKLFSDVIE
jgi:tetratricopeptide (TPR) repeat protein